MFLALFFIAGNEPIFKALIKRLGYFFHFPDSDELRLEYDTWQSLSWELFR
jgi:hypothetical protein